MAEHRGRLIHFVSFKFKKSATPTEINEVTEAFCSLADKIPQVMTLEWGTEISDEGLEGSFTHHFQLTFATERDRDEYINHSEHRAFVGMVSCILEENGARVNDYMAQS